MAPEVFQGAEPSTMTDLWALGCVLYEMFAGKYFDVAVCVLRGHDIHQTDLFLTAVELIQYDLMINVFTV